MDTLELKVPPVIVVCAVAVLMWASKLLFPQLTFHFSFSTFAALGLFLAGFFIIAAGVTTFRRAETTTNPLEPDKASSLVSGGIYSYSRNPMYLGFALVLLAWGFYLSNSAAILLAGLFILYMNRFQIRPEEQILEKKFGDEFKSYKSTVRRWI